MPLPSPVKPRPSVEVADTETFAPAKAFESAAIASDRLVEIFGLLPTICTATFSITKPAALIFTKVSLSNWPPEAPAYFLSETPKLLPKSPPHSLNHHLRLI